MDRNQIDGRMNTSSPISEIQIFAFANSQEAPFEEQGKREVACFG
jgi:hypothetical protein